MAILTPLFFVFRNYKEISGRVTVALVVNILVSTLFVILRKTPGVCDVLPTTEGNPCDFDWREMEAFMFLSCITVIKNRTALSWYQTYSSFFQFAKITSMYLFFRMNFYFGLLYSIICIVRLYFLPDDRIKLPDSVEYLNELDECKKGYWMLTLYTTWSPNCQRMAPVFSDLSREFGSEGLKFGKIDIGRNESVAKKFKIRVSSMSAQLPTVVMLKDGEVVEKRPLVQAGGKLVKYHFSDENIIRDFHLNQIYSEVKNSAGDAKQKKKDE